MARILVTVVTAAAVATAGLVAFLVLIGGSTFASAGTGLVSGSTCATAGPINGLTDAAAANARVVVATATASGGPRAALIALMAGMAESNLRVLGNPHDPSGSQFPNQGLGFDHDSLGIFQQRPGWGSAAQRMDPVASTNLFIDRLLALPDWKALPPWLAAQQVQRSAFSDGSNYRAELPLAARLLAVIGNDSLEVSCGGTGIGTPPRGPVGRYGLPEGYRIPVTASPRARAAIGYALLQLGKPYVFGAEGPDSYDCSGLTQSSWAAAGVAISRVTTAQQYDGTPTSPQRLSPGRPRPHSRRGRDPRLPRARGHVHRPGTRRACTATGRGRGGGHLRLLHRWRDLRPATRRSSMTVWTCNPAMKSLRSSTDTPAHRLDGHMCVPAGPVGKASAGSARLLSERHLS